MIKYHSSLRDLISKVNFKVVSDTIDELYGGQGGEVNSFSAYSRFRDDLLTRVINKDKDFFPIVISFVLSEDDPFGGEDWFNVHYKNPNFIEESPKELKFWGGNFKDKNDCPEDHCNVNWDGYQKFYGISGEDLQNSLDTPVYVENEVILEKLKNEEEAVAHILWEFTSHGFTEKSVSKFWGKVKERVDEIDRGEYKELSLKGLEEEIQKTMKKKENEK